MAFRTASSRAGMDLGVPDGDSACFAHAAPSRRSTSTIEQRRQRFDIGGFLTMEGSTCPRGEEFPPSGSRSASLSPEAAGSEARAVDVLVQSSLRQARVVDRRRAIRRRVYVVGHVGARLVNVEAVGLLAHPRIRA